MVKLNVNCKIYCERDFHQIDFGFFVTIPNLNLHHISTTLLYGFDKSFKKNVIPFRLNTETLEK